MKKIYVDKYYIDDICRTIFKVTKIEKEFRGIPYLPNETIAHVTIIYKGNYNTVKKYQIFNAKWIRQECKEISKLKATLYKEDI